MSPGDAIYVRLDKWRTAICIHINNRGDAILAHTTTKPPADGKPVVLVEPKTRRAKALSKIERPSYFVLLFTGAGGTCHRIPADQLEKLVYEPTGTCHPELLEDLRTGFGL